MEFKKYQHIEKLGTMATEGILNGKVYLFSKLDGMGENCGILRKIFYERLTSVG